MYYTFILVPKYNFRHARPQKRFRDIDIRSVSRTRVVDRVKREGADCLLSSPTRGQITTGATVVNNSSLSQCIPW